MIAALFVESGGVYYGLPNVDPWDENRDARTYPGPRPVIAHPPCDRWCRYWSGGPSARERKILGNDNGCFAAAIRSVRKWGGVLEHPEASHAWFTFGLETPPKNGGWIRADKHGWTCCVEQGHYGHRARKATWLYAVGVTGSLLLPPPDLIWGPSAGERLDEGFHSKAERDVARAAGKKPIKRLSKAENINTPIPFRDLLIGIAESCNRPPPAGLVGG